MNKDVLSTLFVGIDVSSASNYFCAINFEGKHILDFSITNDLPSSEIAVERIFSALNINNYISLVCYLTIGCITSKIYQRCKIMEKITKNFIVKLYSAKLYSRRNIRIYRTNSTRKM